MSKTYIALCIITLLTTATMAQVDPVFNASGHYGQTNISYNLNENVLYSATSRFRVGSTVENGNSGRLFDGDFDRAAITVAAAGNATLTIDLKGKGGLSVAQPKGYLYLNFYESNSCDSLYVRFYDSTGEFADFQYADWENVSTTSPFIRLRLHIPDWVNPTSKIEIKAFAPSAAVLTITEMEYYLENRGQFEGGLVSKWGSNTLYDLLQFADTSNTVKAKIQSNGNAVLSKLGIGTDNINDDSTVLFANGRIRAREIKVDADIWPDYVFEKNYKLLTLPQVQAYINQYGHLPGLPSAAMVVQKGWELGKGQAALLQKIEELTLYLLQQQKDMEGLQRELMRLKAARKQ
ncbi:hypothetical protein A4H97_29700 [Niastella yeongjuensis]|uniref:Uncharacterized protein n=1 Tax=Niastella yeongjuensis TaxID=354355 RepID=A0A1V9EQ51_9BACT|nr:hypothetical protein [Niastella yeongjuensis]OQP48015.1 hypothetical protein A4H97_29700 [Niastella yeongjuensis]SEO23558.1 hypothetical protein SAMN05660816_02339 [Niastella yeongjuensis]